MHKTGPVKGLRFSNIEITDIPAHKNIQSIKQSQREALYSVSRSGSDLNRQINRHSLRRNTSMASKRKSNMRTFI